MLYLFAVVISLLSVILSNITYNCVHLISESTYKNSSKLGTMCLYLPINRSKLRTARSNFPFLEVHWEQQGASTLGTAKVATSQFPVILHLVLHMYCVQ